MRPQIDSRLVTRLLKELVRINSVNPELEESPGEGEVVEYIASRLRQLGLKVRLQEAAPRRPNVIATLRGTGHGRSLMLNGHCDTVGVRNMTIDPFAGVVKNGRLHGRGACDMKGALAAMLAALQAVVDASVVLAGDVVFTAVVDEEFKSAGIRRLCEEVRCDAAIVGEPTGLAVAIAHKGFMWLQAEVYGKAAHGSVPERGVDAIVHAAHMVSALEQLGEAYRGRRHPLLGPPVLHMSWIDGGREWATVPDYCRLRFERRTLPTEDHDAAFIEIQRAVEQAVRGEPRVSVKMAKVFEDPALTVKEDELVVAQLCGAIGDMLRAPAKIIGVPYWSDAAILATAGRMPACLFGPGDIGVAHSADEYVALEDVATAARIYTEVIERFCGSKA